MTNPILIGLTGYAGTGKDTVRALLEQQGYHGLAFADPIRQMLRNLLINSGAGEEWMDNRELKEAVIPSLGVSYRHMAQTLGTEWGRNLQADFWLRIAGGYMADIASVPELYDTPRFVISDVRFANEAQWVRKRGGVIWRIERPGTAPVRSHVSESEIYSFAPDVVIANNGDFEALFYKVAAMVGGTA